MNTMQLSCFVEVATQLSFSKAAEALHVSQPTVSHQIKALEDELGCALLVRSTRTVRLTDDGFAFLEERPNRRAAREPRSRGRAQCGVDLPTAHGVPRRIVLAKGAQYIRATYP